MPRQSNDYQRGLTDGYQKALETVSSGLRERWKPYAHDRELVSIVYTELEKHAPDGCTANAISTNRKFSKLRSTLARMNVMSTPASIGCFMRGYREITIGKVKMTSTRRNNTAIWRAKKV